MSAAPAGRIATRQRARGPGCRPRQALPGWCGAKCTVPARTTRSVSGAGRQLQLAPRCWDLELCCRWRGPFPAPPGEARMARRGAGGGRRSGGYGWGSDLPHWPAIARCPVAGRAAAGPGVAVPGVAVPGVAVPGVAGPAVAALVAQLGYPGAHFMSADIRWRDL